MYHKYPIKEILIQVLVPYSSISKMTNIEYFAIFRDSSHSHVSIGRHATIASQQSYRSCSSKIPITQSI